MRLMRTSLFLTAALAVFFAAPAFSNTQSGPDTTWRCPQADGSEVYTNKEKTGCQLMTLKPLSVVPDLETMPTIPQPSTVAAPHYQVPSFQDRGSGVGGRNVPDWAKDWHASVAPSGSVQEEVCALYSEWLHLVQKTRGGMFYGTDPSYGGDLSGRNQRGASYSFYDNTRYVTLSRIFGAGFVPIGCW